VGEGGTTINSTVQPLIHFGYQQTMAQEGITVGPGLVRQSGRTIDEVYQAVRVLFAERRDFTPASGNVSIEEASPLILPTQIVVRKSTGPAPKEAH
jgi:hypothetical protein